MGWWSAVTSRIAQAFVVDQVGRDLDRLSDALRAAAPESRREAVSLLADVRADGALDLLLAALRDGDAGVRALAASACGARGDVGSIDALAVLLSDSEAAVRLAAARALDGIGTPAASLDLAPPIGASHAVVPRDARVPDLLARLLRDADEGVRGFALAALPRHGEAGVRAASLHVETAADRAPLLPLLERGLVAALRSDDPGHRRAAVEALRAHGCAGAASHAIERLRDDDEGVREAAVAAVAALAPEAAGDALLARLDDPGEEAATRAVESLVAMHSTGRLGPGEADALHEKLLAMAAHGSGASRQAATWALGQLGRTRAVATLVDLLDEKDPGVAIHACGALERLRDPRAVLPLAKVAGQSEVAGARAAALQALGALGDVRPVSVLVERLFRDPDAACVEAADAALGAICRDVEQREGGAFASPEAAERLAAIARTSGDVRAARLLLQALAEAPDEPTRVAADEALRRLGLHARALVEASLALADQPEGRRLLALALAERVAPERVAGLAEGLLADANEPPAVHLRAVDVLSRSSAAGARRALEAASSHASPAVREAVARALAPPPR